jgi:YegS/Rv2252/BmrU family lipid kinase
MDAAIRSSTDIKRVVVILNPASGLKNEAEQFIKTYLAELEHDITYCVTQKKGDAIFFALKAVADKADLVLAYGGDGTMTEVAAGLIDSNIPLGMLPGGTANVMAIELGIPTALPDALDLIFKQPNLVRAVDMGRIDNQPFLLRAGIGYEAELSSTADREAKRAHGRLAYFQHAFSLIKNLRRARYKITVDGKTHVAHGITCMICNSTSVGVNNLSLVNQSNVSDGLLDVVVIEGLGIRSLFKIFTSIFQKVIPGRADAPPAIHHWQGAQITIEMRPRQLVAFDGEKLKYAKRVSAVVMHKAVQIIVPEEVAAATATNPIEESAA